MSESIILYHNARCSKSRATLELLKDRGVTPKIVDYLAEPPSVLELKALAEALGVGPLGMMRPKEAMFGELGLAEKVDDAEALFEAMASHPILMERPIVSYRGKARIGRPPEAVLDVLD